MRVQGAFEDEFVSWTKYTHGQKYLALSLYLHGWSDDFVRKHHLIKNDRVLA